MYVRLIFILVSIATTLTLSILYSYRDNMETATIVEQLEEVRLDIGRAKADLERVRGDRDLELEVRRTLNLLLEDKKTLTNALTSSGNY